MTVNASYNDYVLRLKDISRRDVNRAGGKAATLGELAVSQFPVPDGFVLTTAAFELFLIENSFHADSSPEAVADGRIPAAVVAALTKAIADLGDISLVVRSSGIAEDLSGASFAGQYVTVVDVRGADAAMNAVRQCWASAFSRRVTAYRMARGQKDIASMAVLIQRLVRADAAGVAFTAHPVTGERAETVVSAVCGLGERLVSGEASPDEWLVKEGKAVRQRTPEEAINESQALAIAELAKRVERHFGSPQDIEWAIAGGQLFLLQARPITALSEQTVVSVPTEPPPGFWQREASHYPRPLSPMFRVLLEAFNASIKRAMADFSLLMEGIEFREIGGWVYQRMVPLGGKDRPMPPAWLIPLLIRVVPRMRSRINGAVNAVRSDKSGSYIERWHRQWRPEFAENIARLRNVDLAALTDEKLDEHINEVTAFFRHTLDIHTLLNVAVLATLADVAFVCRDFFGWDDRKILDLFSGLSEKSSEPSRQLARLAQMARERPVIRKLLEEQIDDNTVKRLADVDKNFADALSAYLREFGCRTLRIEVNDQTLAEAPALVLGLIRDQLVRGYDPAADAAALEKKRAAMIADARKTLAARPPQERERFERVLARGEQAYPIREDNQFYNVSVPMALLRYAVLELGRRLADRKQIAYRDAVFFFELEEARAALRDGTDQRSLVERRKAERVWVEAHPCPASYGKDPGPPPSFAAFPPEARFLMEGLLWATNHVFAAGHGSHIQANNKVLRGIAASPGVYTGTVRVVMNESEFLKLRPGDVLVCPITSPVWSVLFPSVGALVTDTGGILSHPAIIAREYRVPAVVAAENATGLLRDGQIVTVDGNNGLVEIGS